MEFDDVANGVVEHIEARSFFYLVGAFVDIDEVEERCQDLVHALNILNLGVQTGVNIQNPSHIVVPVGLPLLVFARKELPITEFIFPVNEFEFLPSGTCQVGDHHFLALAGKEGELGMSARSVLFYLFPEKIIFLEFVESRLVFFDKQGVVLEFGWGKKHLH